MTPSPNRAPDLPQPPSPVDVDLLVVGAGPTGLTAACEALRLGLTVRIVDRKQGLSTHSKALVTHARTMEVLETMGVADAMLEAGVPFAALNAHAGPGRRPTRVDLLGLPWGDTSYPFWLSIPQYATEQVLEQHLQNLGGAVEWGTTFADLDDRGDHVVARIEVGGEPQEVRARWVIGCDGGRSTVRDQIGLRLDRRESGVRFLLADVAGTAPLVEDEGYAYLAPEGLLIIVPVPEPGRWRIIAHVDDAEERTIDAAYLDDLIAERTGLDFGARDVGWTSRFTLSHGVADAYRRGRVFLAGDAAHVHSPVGGQGLNTGIQDAHNLVWKLAESGRAQSRAAAEALLDSYERERRAAGAKMVATVARMTALITVRNRGIRRVLGWIAPRALALPRLHARLGRGAGMLETAYPDGPMDAGPGAGRRLPDPELADGRRLSARLPGTGWCWVVRTRAGDATPDLEGPRWRGLPVVVVREEELLDGGRAGSLDHPIALVRPDRVLAGVGSAPEELRPPTLGG
ncbi:FAD-dependent monooxygenase [Agromyces sp. H66]|uniref:FAD-dependent monooxygenase n=1 Tax=Agromyces sp. H66 TaxID=2529859 RepID=UPI0010AABF14|nr:FAD-dependent monooxygenase [Agromyces sp. H66]